MPFVLVALATFPTAVDAQASITGVVTDGVELTGTFTASVNDRRLYVVSAFRRTSHGPATAFAREAFGGGGKPDTTYKRRQF
jgi:hypothetical protein